MSAAEHDVVVVGGGTAGAIVAARLAEQSELDVCLLEAGPSDEGSPQFADVRRWIELLHSEWDFDYQIEPQPRGNGEIRHSRARVLGGCSTHNSVIAFLPPEHDLAAWTGTGVEGWSAADLSGAIERVLARVHLEPAQARNPFVAAWVDAALDAGFPAADFDGGRFAPGIGWVHVNARGRHRVSSSAAYLHPLERSPANLHVRCDSPARRLLIDSAGRAVGVELDGGTVRARREVVLCCGVFETPKLLLLSGIGPAEKLAPHGISVLEDLPGVGEHLLDHPEGVVSWRAAREVPDDATQYLEATLIAGSRPHERHELMCWCFSIPFDEATLRRDEPGPAEPVCSMAFDVSYARSEGTVALRSADPRDPPLIDPRYFTDPDGHDERVALDGLALARELARREPLAGWISAEVAPGAHVQDPAELSAYVRRTAYTAYHPVGSCRMGAGADDRSVVDSRLRVRGVPNLRIADASIFPGPIGVNPCITCMVIGERCAELMLRELAD